MRIASLIATLLVGCSSLGSVYKRSSYVATQPDAVKHIKILGWAPPQEGKLGALLARMTADQVKLRKNYLVHESKVLQEGWYHVCHAPVQGALIVRAMESATQGDRASFQLSMELLRCSDGALLWRSEAKDSGASSDEDLKHLVGNYQDDFDVEARIYAAPAFGIIQDLVNALPDPTLTDEEILTKIELD